MPQSEANFSLTIYPQAEIIEIEITTKADDFFAETDLDWVEIIY